MFCNCVILGFIRCAESIPILIGVPLTAFLNDSSHRYGRAGYFICSASTAISAILMFFVGYPTVRLIVYLNQILNRFFIIFLFH